MFVNAEMTGPSLLEMQTLELVAYHLAKVEGIVRCSRDVI